MFSVMYNSYMYVVLVYLLMIAIDYKNVSDMCMYVSHVHNLTYMDVHVHDSVDFRMRSFPVKMRP